MNKGLDCFALTIVIIGAINWGLIGFLGFDLVAWLFGNMSLLSRLRRLYQEELPQTGSAHFS